MSSESNSDEVPVNVVSENQVESNSNESIKEPKKNIEINDFPEESESSQTHIEELTKLLDLEKQKVIESEWLEYIGELLMPLIDFFHDFGTRRFTTGKTDTFL